MSGGARPAVAAGLRLAATPTFAVMAVLAGAVGTDPMEAICSSGHPFAASGMVPMYLLMSVFHLPPWLTLAASRRPRRGVGRPSADAAGEQPKRPRLVRALP